MKNDRDKGLLFTGVVIVVLTVIALLFIYGVYIFLSGEAPQNLLN